MDNAPIISPDPGPATTGLTARELDAVRARRASLRQASRTAWDVLRADGGPPAHAGALLEAVDVLGGVWATHSAETESPDGVLAQVLADCPRLAHAITRLRQEHEQVAQALAAVHRQLAAAPSDAPVDPATGVPALANALDTVERHRRAGRELFHNAYQVDLGLGE